MESLWPEKKNKIINFKRKVYASLMFRSCKFYGDCIVTPINKISGCHFKLSTNSVLVQSPSEEQGGREMFPHFSCDIIS